ncbi:MAG: four helix bundle protein [Culturomica sp.]|jgi:hypothetical protein|nr:four helix bundle protein [Culturomica sp.]
MGLYEELPVFKASYDLLLALFILVKNLTREYKYTIGEDMKKEVLETVKLIYVANTLRDKSEKIFEARQHLATFRIYLRLMMDMKQIGLKKFTHINLLVENVSKQLAGWQKSM